MRSDLFKILVLRDLSKGRKLHNRMKFAGMDISVENRKGSYRHWYDPHSKQGGKTKMLYPYGYIRRTEGTDGDHVDVFVGPDKSSERVFVVNQMKKPPGSTKGDGKKWINFDEQKCFLGFRSAEDAKRAYLAHYDDPRFFGTMSEMKLDEFKKKVFAANGKALSKGGKLVLINGMKLRRL